MFDTHKCGDMYLDLLFGKKSDSDIRMNVQPILPWEMSTSDAIRLYRT